ncbi:hypothetical protein VTO42DRAFT_7731 [Malbranchea cinnamomea]
MEAFDPAPEDIMLPPSPPEPIEAPASSANPSCVPSIHAEDSSTRSNSPAMTAASSISTLPPPPAFPAPPRNRSPLSRAHLRSRSLAGPPTAPFMARAHSSPGLAYSANQKYSQDVQDLTLRQATPPCVSMEETTDTVCELPELRNTPSPNVRRDMSPVPMYNTFSRQIRRRPSSPLHHSSGNSSSTWGFNSQISTQSSQPSPFTFSTRFNEPYPAYSVSSGSSMPSTPSSIRSRSPSISSLETIPDIPDAEAAAIEADQIAKLRAAADKADAAAGNEYDRRRVVMDMSGSPTPFGGTRFSLGRFDKRKRWSVCGAEGRHDFDLETIWED